MEPPCNKGQDVQRINVQPLRIMNYTGKGHILGTFGQQRQYREAKKKGVSRRILVEAEG